MSLKNTLENMATPDLVSTRSEIDKLIAQRQRDEMKALRSRWTKEAREHGLTIDAIVGTVRPKPVPKFKNPDNPSQVWSGQGRRPEWMKKGDESRYLNTEVAAAS